MSQRLLIVSALSVLTLFVASLTQPRDVLLYNPSSSIPVGLYLRVRERPRVGSIVTIRAIEAAPGYATSRNFTDDGDRFIKRVAASGGDTVCAQGDRIEINRHTIVRRARQDSMGHLLLQWSGCRRLESSEVFLLGETPDSFDSRYFGAVRVDQIEGVWRRF